MRANEPERLLHVTTGYFCAGAVWRKIHGIWSCTEAAPILRWMVGKTVGEAKVALLKMGAEWGWSQPGDGEMRRFKHDCAVMPREGELREGSSGYRRAVLPDGSFGDGALA